MPTIHTNSWNRIRYTVWEPIYDLLAWPLRRSRARSIERLGITTTDEVLLVGAGTGLDLPLIRMARHVVATDITPAMLRRLERRLQRTALHGEVRRLDAHAMDLPDASFDKVVLNLVIAVVTGPDHVLRETERVLRPGGRAVVFDKFAPPRGPIPLWQRFFNPITQLLFSTIDRRFEEILSATSLTVITDEKAPFGLGYRIIVLGKERPVA